jgi:hypothetical protein
MDADLLQRKRELRAKIGRLRRRLDGRFRDSRDHARLLLSWRTYVVRYPVWAMAAALGAGIAASTGLKPARLSRRLGFSLVRYALAKFQQSLLAEFWRLASDIMAQKRDRP